MKICLSLLVVLSHAACVDSFNLIPQMRKVPVLLKVSRDEYFQPHFESLPGIKLDLDRMVECAETGQCSLAEMNRMVQEIDELNESCSHHYTLFTNNQYDCDVEAVEARMAMKHALTSQMELQQARKELHESEFYKHKVSRGQISHTHNLDDHVHGGFATVGGTPSSSLDHYRQIAEYESH